MGEGFGYPWDGPCKQIPGGEAMAPRPGPSALAAAAGAELQSCRAACKRGRCPPCRKPDHGTPCAAPAARLLLLLVVLLLELHRPSSTIYRRSKARRATRQRTSISLGLVHPSPPASAPTCAPSHLSGATLVECLLKRSRRTPRARTAPAPLDNAACSSSATELPSLFGWQALPQAMTAAGLAGYHCTYLGTNVHGKTIIHRLPATGGHHVLIAGLPCTCRFVALHRPSQSNNRTRIELAGEPSGNAAVTPQPILHSLGCPTSPTVADRGKENKKSSHQSLRNFASPLPRIWVEPSPPVAITRSWTLGRRSARVYNFTQSISRPRLAQHIHVHAVGLSPIFSASTPFIRLRPPSVVDPKLAVCRLSPSQ
jgi:hypothetical protein